MKKRLRDQKAISLITLSITVVVLVIITNVIIYNLQDNLGLEKLTNMQNDIENLRSKVDTYYAQYGTIPKINTEYTNTGNISELISVNDTGKFYVIDLSSLENLTLTYGEGYREITEETTPEQINNIEDIYIINEASHNIFYIKGIMVDNETYHTDYTKEDVDTKKVEIRYVDGVKIPDGFVYESGTSVEDLVIVGKDSDAYRFKWVPVEDGVTLDTCPRANNTSSSQKEDLVNSINKYKGYYYFEAANLIQYIEIEDNWSPIYDKEAKYTDKNGDTAYIPAGFQVSRMTGSDNIKEGLVVKNAATDNRYVWIKVPKSIFKTVMSNEDYTNIEMDMKDYTSDYAGSEYIFDSWDSNNCAITDENEYNTLKNNMLKSIYNNGGFWISQYEIGVDIQRTSAQQTLPSEVYSQQGKYPLNYITCTQAQEISSTIESNIGERQTSLLFGIQWRLAMKAIENSGEKVKSELITDSSTWGNYLSANFEIYRGKYSTDNGQTYLEPSSMPYTKAASSDELVTTGTAIRNRVLNIYDLAGNVGEWTLERGYNSHGVYGGSYTNDNSAYKRIHGTSTYDGTQWSESDVGLRVGLY